MTSGSSDVQGLDPSPHEETEQGPELVPTDDQSTAAGPVDVDDTEAGTESTDTAAPADAPDDAPDDEDAAAVREEGLRWNIVEDDPGNPFTSNLVFSEDGEPLLWWTLDPVTVNELMTALAAVKRTQLAALTGKPVPSVTETTTPADTPGHTRPTPPEPVDKTDWPWWRRHKAATAFLILLALMFLIPLVTVGNRV